MRKFLLGAMFATALTQINAAPVPNFHIYTSIIGSQNKTSSSENEMGFAQVEHFATGSLTIAQNGNVQLSLAKSEPLTVKIYSSLGKEVLDLSGNYAGTNTLMLAGRLPASRYIVSVLGESLKAIKPVLVK